MFEKKIGKYLGGGNYGTPFMKPQHCSPISTSIMMLKFDHNIEADI